MNRDLSINTGISSSGGTNLEQCYRAVSRIPEPWLVRSAMAARGRLSKVARNTHESEHAYLSLAPRIKAYDWMSLFAEVAVTRISA